MKLRIKLAITIFYCMGSYLAFAQTKTLTTIGGNVDKELVKKVYLYVVEEGEMKEYASTQIDADNNYAFALTKVEEGFYYLGDNLKGKPVYNRFYLKQGETVTLDLHQTGYDLNSKSAENKILGEWEKLYAEIAVPAFQFWGASATYVTFFPTLKNILPKAAAFKKKINTPNKAFNNLLTLVVDSDIEYAAIQFLYTPRSAHPSKEERPDYYNSIINQNKFCDTRLLKLGDAMSRLDRYAMFYTMNSGIEIKPGDQLQHSVNAICNDTLKGMLAVNRVSRYKSLEKLQDDLAPYKKYFLTDSIRAKYLRFESSLASYAKGEKAYNFSYPDINGNTVTLASFKGKVVLVDTWATWCMPCKKEIPHLKKLEEELKGKDIAIVSLSVDEAKDETKWKDFVKKEKLGGIQLYAKGFSEFAKYYKINAIPRFLIFDKEGKIVTVDSPRPSEPELKELLLKLTEG